MSDAQLIYERATGIGGTDISAIIGVNPWRSPVDVWAEKTGRGVPAPDNPAMRAGRLLEPVIAQMYSEDTGLTVTRGLPEIRKEGVLIGHLDGLVAAAGRVWEAKTARTGDGWGAPGTDDVPLHYAAQVQWYCGLSELPAADVAVLIGGSDFRIYHLRADAALFAEMRDAALRFWRDHVQADAPPAPRSVSDASTLWPTSSARIIEADDALADKVLRLHAAKTAIRELTAEADKLDEDVRLAFADADTLSRCGTVLATFKSQSASRFDQRAFAAAHPDLFEQFKRPSTSRVLRLK
jgi:putative phage-type endonuclease